MKNKDFQMLNYIPSKIFKGKIEIIGRRGRVICTLDVTDFKSKKEVKKIAE